MLNFFPEQKGIVSFYVEGHIYTDFSFNYNFGGGGQKVQPVSIQLVRKDLIGEI